MLKIYKFWALVHGFFKEERITDNNKYVLPETYKKDLENMLLGEILAYFNVASVSSMCLGVLKNRQCAMRRSIEGIWSTTKAIFVKRSKLQLAYRIASKDSVFNR